MKNAKKISVLLLALATTYIRPGSESMADRITYSQETNDKFIYDKKVDRELLNDQEINDSVEIKIEKHRFDSGITRTRTQVKVEGNEIVTTIETWITNNPSRLTATNLALGGAAALGAVGLGYLYRDDLQSVADRAGQLGNDLVENANEYGSAARERYNQFADNFSSSMNDRYQQAQNYFIRNEAQPAAIFEAARDLGSEVSSDSNGIDNDEAGL